MLSAQSYYGTYSGHDEAHLKIIKEGLQRQGKKRTIYLAGDSSLDNKYWFHEHAPALNGFEQILQPRIMKQDVCYWMNSEAVQRGEVDLVCINTAVEATSLNNRACCWLTAQDRLIQDHIQEEDTLIVSVGGNDIALAPLLCTVVSMAAMVCCTPQVCLESCACACPPNLVFDMGCFCCGLPKYVYLHSN
jgi:hypothetical protein